VTKFDIGGGFTISLGHKLSFYGDGSGEMVQGLFDAISILFGIVGAYRLFLRGLFWLIAKRTKVDPRNRPAADACEPIHPLGHHWSPDRLRTCRRVPQAPHLARRPVYRRTGSVDRLSALRTLPGTGTTAQL
jgi:hypothetical protein